LLGLVKVVFPISLRRGRALNGTEVKSILKGGGPAGHAHHKVDGCVMNRAAVQAASLLCLDLRHEWVARREPWLDAAAAVLAHGRSLGWRVAHAYHVKQPSPDKPVGALPGFEPRRGEPVYTLFCASALEHLAAQDWFSRGAAGDTYLIGRAYSRGGMATAVSAFELGKRLLLVTDACGRDAREGPHDASPRHGRLCPPLLWSVSSTRLLNGEPNRVMDLGAHRTALALAKAWARRDTDAQD
jgi:hypothetical protein